MTITIAKYQHFGKKIKFHTMSIDNHFDNEVTENIHCFRSITQEWEALYGISATPLIQYQGTLAVRLIPVRLAR